MGRPWQPQDKEAPISPTARSTSIGSRGGHTCLQPPLGHRIDVGRFGGGECLVEAKNAAIAAVLRTALHRERGLKTTVCGRVACGRHKVLTHGNRKLWNLDQSESRPPSLHEHVITRGLLLGNPRCDLSRQSFCAQHLGCVGGKCCCKRMICVMQLFYYALIL